MSNSSLNIALFFAQYSLFANHCPPRKRSCEIVADRLFFPLQADPPGAEILSHVLIPYHGKPLDSQNAKRHLTAVNTVYTTTITQEARRRGIGIDVIDAQTPVFILKHNGRQIRCYNSLTDRVGAVTFHLAQDKRLAHVFLERYGFPVPKQIKYDCWASAQAFLEKYKSVVVKPCREWGGRGVSVAVTTGADLKGAIARAQKFGGDVIVEQYVEGQDQRLIFVDGLFVAAIQREPACVIGNGTSSIRALILRKNVRSGNHENGNRIPLDAETRRNLAALGLGYGSVPRKGVSVRVRLTSNYHTGGSVSEITDSVSADLVREGQKIVRLFDIPVLGVDFLVNPQTSRHWVIELSPDLAISPPEGKKVAQHFLNYLFPETSAGVRPVKPAPSAKRGLKKRKLHRKARGRRG